MDERETCKTNNHVDSLPCNDDIVALDDEVHRSKSRKKARGAPPIVHPSAKRRGVKVTIDPLVNIENMISSPARVTRHSAKAMEENASDNIGSPSGKGGPTDVANQPNTQPQVYNYPVSMLKHLSYSYTKNCISCHQFYLSSTILI